jgi:1,4-dihydroxy-2-naphthoate polyprenyltransferase
VDLRLLVVGIVAIAAAALYTGGPRPYGYSGLGEVAVLVFFGVVATAGSAYVQLERVPATAWWGSLAVGLLACAILLANNIRDVDTDRSAGKRTLAVRTGARGARALFVGCIAGAFVAVAAVGVLEPPALIALAAVPLAVPPVRLVLTRNDPPSLVAALVGTARLQLVVAVLLTVGLVTS